MFTLISNLLCKRQRVLPVRCYYQKGIFQIHVHKTLQSIGFVMFVCLSARLSAGNNSVPTGQIFMKFDI